jgi:hypothetical protein
MISFSINKCPFCSFIYKIEIGFGIKLGPPIAICAHCHKQINTGLFEWGKTKVEDRILFIIVTIISIIFGGYFIAAPLYVLLTHKLFIDANWRDWQFISLYSIIGAIIALLTILTITFSKEREKTDGKLITLSLFTWYINSSLWYFIILIFVLFLTYVIGFST